MRATVPATWTVRGVIEIKPARTSLEDTRAADWVALARAQQQIWNEKVRPLLEKYPSTRIAYFGLAPIPLAVHLGSLLERWSHVSVFLRHHRTKTWEYSGDTGPQVLGPTGPNEMVRATEPAIIALSTTAPADLEAMRSIIGATSAELAIQTQPLGEDVLVTEASVNAVAEQFHRALELLESNRPGVSEVHLAAAIPVGLAFLCGAQLTSTRHARIVTYQYHRSAEPRLVEALRLPLRTQQTVAVSGDESQRAEVVRSDWETQRQKLVAQFGGDGEANGHWSSVLGRFGEKFSTGAFALLESVRDTPLLSPVNLKSKEVSDGFRYDRPTASWELGDGLLTAVVRTVGPSSLSRAGRLLLLHEALHHGKQGLDGTSARQIRLAPKVLEEIDYLADVWALVHEYAFSGLLAKDWQEQRAELLAILETAIQTMWAFDVGRDVGVLEVRRVNRYLVWYANLVRLENARSLNQAIDVLAMKPVIELVGPQ
ncbi:MAG TPA: SAVED domain-containing protein, partial [Polyangiaceae bacterium]|nr:SAVED domain-containing protein [Polyangiaceae bacterium]